MRPSILALTLSVACFAGLASAGADSYPQRHSVTGVAADDVLNIRAAPSASAAIIGTLAPDATGVEVVATNESGTWGLVNVVEQSGWASLAYLAPEGVSIDNYNLPVGMRCFGTEPFWSLTPQDGALQFERLGEDPVGMDVWIAQDSGIPQDLTRMILAAGLGGPATAYIHPGQCNDGMSDRSYGLNIGLMTAPDAPLLRGCCTLGH